MSLCIIQLIMQVLDYNSACVNIMISYLPQIPLFYSINYFSNSADVIKAI